MALRLCRAIAAADYFSFAITLPCAAVAAFRFAFLSAARAAMLLLLIRRRFSIAIACLMIAATPIAAIRAC